MYDGIHLLQKLGRGGIAEVWEAEWEGRPVALKLLLEPERRSLRSRFLREGWLLQRLSHPGLRQCYHVFEGARPALVLELLRGRTLRDARPITGEEGDQVAASLLRTLQYLHRQGIVHRDVKPANVMLTDDGRVVLVDLGMAQDPADPAQTTLGEVLGTAAYMAPEQLSGSETDARADLYSLGVTLYEALCGQLPFSGQGVTGWLAAHRSGTHVPLDQRKPELPGRLVQLVERLVARDPWQRPPSAAAALGLLTGVRPAGQLDLPPLVGRGALVGALEALLDGGGALRVTGEPGSGLGTVVRLAAERAARHRIEHLRIRCIPGCTSEDLWRRLAAELSSLLGPVGSDPQRVHRALRDLSIQEDRLLLLISDVDLAPLPFRQWLQDLPVALLVTAHRLPPEPTGRILELRPLTRAEIQTLLELWLGTAPPSGLAQALWRWTSGLAGLTVEAVRDLHRRGGLRWEEGEWLWDPSVSPVLEPLEMARYLADTDAEVGRRLVEVLVLGDGELPLEVLLEASGVDRSGLDLGPAFNSGLLRREQRQGEDWVVLRRPAMEPLLRAGMDPERVKALEEPLLERVRARPQGEWESRFLTQHEARRGGPALGRLLSQVAALMQEGREREGLVLLGRLRELPPVEPDLVVTTAVLRGDALRAEGRLLEARQAIGAAAALVAEVSSPSSWREALLVQVEWELEAGHPVASESWMLLERLLPREPRARYLLARRAARAGERSLARRYLEEVGDRGRLGLDVLALRAAMLAEEGRLSEACEELERLEGRLASRGLHSRRRTIRLQRAGYLLRLARFSKVLEILGETGDEELRWEGPTRCLLRASVALACGAVEETASLLEEGKELGMFGAPYGLRSFWLGADARRRRLVSDVPALLEAHLRAQKAATDAGDRVLEAYHGAMLGVYGADTEAISRGATVLAETDVPALRAGLYMAGAVIGGDPELLPYALEAAQASGEPLLVWRVARAAGQPAELSPEVENGLPAHILRILRGRS